MEVIPILNLFCMQGPGMFRDNEKMFFNMSFALDQSARSVATVSTAVFVLILQANIKKKSSDTDVL